MSMTLTAIDPTWASFGVSAHNGNEWSPNASERCRIALLTRAKCAARVGISEKRGAMKENVTSERRERKESVFILLVSGIGDHDGITSIRS
jgi:hypothetical protein